MSGLKKVDSYDVELVAGAEADTKSAALKPGNTTRALRVGDILFDDNGTRLADNSAAEKLAWKAYADQAEADAVSTAAADATNKDSALETSLKAYADKAEADAIIEAGRRDGIVQGGITALEAKLNATNFGNRSRGCSF